MPGTVRLCSRHEQHLAGLRGGRLGFRDSGASKLRGQVVPTDPPIAEPLCSYDHCLCVVAIISLLLLFVILFYEY